LAETKNILSYGSNVAIITGQTTPQSILNLLPAVAQGTGQGQRIGNMIQGSYLQFKGYINSLPYDATSNPNINGQYVKMWILSSKIFPNGTAPVVADFQHLFNNGSSDLGMQGTMLDLILPFNKDRYTLHKTKIFKIGGASSSTVGAVQQIILPNNDFHLSSSFNFNLTKYFGNLKFDDTLLNNFPTNKNLAVIFTTVDAAGVQQGGGNSCAEFHYSINWQYKDL